MRFIKKNEEYNYFDEFEKNASYSLECAKMVYRVIENYDPGNLERKIQEIHEVEHMGDKGKHTMTNYLATDFLPPIEREDILRLSQKIDDVTDRIEEIVISMDMFNITELRKDIIDFANLVITCCEIEHDLLVDFKNFKKNHKIKEKVIELNRLEEQGDKLYRESMKKLYRDNTSTADIIKWTTIYNHFEECIDMCENVANDIEEIALKNT